VRRPQPFVDAYATHMEEIGLFPLATVLLPAEEIPLHIFEPRYRELIGECLEQETEFGLVYSDDDGIQEIGTRAGVVSAERLPDGRLNIVARGGERFRLLELTDGRSFHTGWVEPVEDQADPAPAGDVTRALQLFERVVEITGAATDPPDRDQPLLSFDLAGRFDLAPALKQSLLVQTSERERLARVCEILEGAAAAAVRLRELHALAQRNGHPHPPDS